jgi:hypothetical protein
LIAASLGVWIRAFTGQPTGPAHLSMDHESAVMEIMEILNNHARAASRYP